jgi:hypothetical protein
MRKAEDYRKHAEQCRAMARNIMHEVTRQALIEMAETWESLASDHKARIAQQQRIEKTFRQ